MRLFSLLIFCLLSLCPPLAQAHPYHESLAEMEWNQQQQAWEISIKVLPEELERALELGQSKRINLDKTPGVDQIILGYLHRVITIKSVGDDIEIKPKLEWVGKEVNYKAAWLYVRLEGAPPPVDVSFRLFFELENSQVNRVFHLLNGKRIPYDFPAAEGARKQRVSLD